MCGIAGLIYKRGEGRIGHDMIEMCHALGHRGPDSTGFALYGENRQGDYIAWVKLEEASPLERSDYERYQREEIRARIDRLGGTVHQARSVLSYADRLDFSYDGELKLLIDSIEAVGPEVEITGVGRAMELVKDVGLARDVGERYGLGSFRGTHGIGHARMATESKVDVSHAHPFWAYPYADICVVHNGQITNYWKTRRLLEGRGHRFRSQCDSELIAVYIAWQLDGGLSLDDALHSSLEDLDGVFTYIVATENELGVAKDELAAKPLVVMESDYAVALASEEVALRTVFDEELPSYDPYDQVVLSWEKPAALAVAESR
jgi:glutamate synthase domain-containing protein 1